MNPTIQITVDGLPSNVILIRVDHPAAQLSEWNLGRFSAHRVGNDIVERRARLDTLLEASQTLELPQLGDLRVIERHAIGDVLVAVDLVFKGAVVDCERAGVIGWVVRRVVLVVCCVATGI